MVGLSKRCAKLAIEVGRLLVERRMTLSGGESCTGGLVGHHITDVPGCSAYFLGGAICYANEIKRDVLGVPEGDLMAHGAVSPQVALALAKGARRLFGTDVGYGVTGIAGPTGGTPLKPVGTVYVAVSTPVSARVEHHLWKDDRVGNKGRSAEAVLALLIREMGG